MPSKFLESVASKLGETWVSQVLSPAFAFWLIGLLAWIWSTGWDDAVRRLDSWANAREQPSVVLVGIAALVLVTASGSLVQRLSLPILRLLEGYWPKWLRRLRRMMCERQMEERDRLEQEWQKLADAVTSKKASNQERERYVELDEQLRRYPTGAHVMPTRLGNVLRASETGPRDRYGLELTRCWLHLWLLLPASSRAELETKRTGLDASVSMWVWSLLLTLWAFWAWWAPLLAVVSVVIVHRGLLLPAARAWSDELEVTADLYRFRLYRQLGLALPETTTADKEMGELVNEYLLRGSAYPITFQHHTDEEA